jgi:hypothetical protein
MNSGTLFGQQRDRADDIFSNLPPPAPSRAPRQDFGSSSAGAGGAPKVRERESECVCVCGVSEVRE